MRVASPAGCDRCTVTRGFDNADQLVSVQDWLSHTTGFSYDSAGNLATEQFVYLLDELGVPTGADLARLLEVCRLAEAMVGHPLPSAVARAGPRLSG